MYNQSVPALHPVQGSLIQGPDSKAEQYQRLIHTLPELMHLIAAIKHACAFICESFVGECGEALLNQLFSERGG